MKTTLSYNRQMFNVKAIAEAGLTPSQVPDNTLAIIDVATDKTVAPDSYAKLPNKFRILQKFDGQVIYSFDCIDKRNIVWSQAKEYKAAVQEKWEAVIKHCNCIDTIKLNIFVQSEALNRRMGLPWGTNDFFLEVSPAEFECYCSCNETGAYANNVLTMLLYKQALKANSCFYSVSVETEDGQALADLKAIEDFVAANKPNNTDKDKANDGKLLKLVIEAKALKKPKRFNPYNDMYSYPDGVKLLPSLEANSRTLIEFKKVSTFNYEIGAGIDLVQEEHNNRSYYTNLGTYQSDMDIIEYPEYQFEESKKYDTLTLEFDSPKTIRAGEADMKRFMIVFGSEIDLREDIHKKLAKVFAVK